MDPMAFQITGVSTVVQPFVQAQMKGNIKAPRHWPLWRKSTGDPHIGPVTQKMFPFDDIIMKRWLLRIKSSYANE